MSANDLDTRAIVTPPASGMTESNSGDVLDARDPENLDKKLISFGFLGYFNILEISGGERILTNPKNS